MNSAIRAGMSFGLASGVITTIGLIVGLYTGTGSKLAVIGGILTIAIADAFSDALGIHISQESQNNFRNREVWEATLATFLAKFLFASTFVVPVLVFSLTTAVVVGVAWGLLLLGFFSYLMSVENRRKAWGPVVEHLLIAVVVIVVTYQVGKMIAELFNK